MVTEKYRVMLSLPKQILLVEQGITQPKNKQLKKNQAPEIKPKKNRLHLFRLLGRSSFDEKYTTQRRNDDNPNTYCCKAHY